ncbi:MAG: pyridoxal-phosphate dependent enzyme [bacterium]|nr:pyridoxal-phosphate dependent enzyme [bacterium]
MKPANCAIELIGNTPLLRVNKLDTGCAELYLKLENQNPGGSIKDRVALSMIEGAEKAGKLKPGGLIVEATAGNTGLGLALVASQKDYRLLLVLPDKMSQEKIFHLKALGAEVLLTRSDVGVGHPEYYQDMARRIAREQGGYYINQFANPDNPKAHETTTAPEIWEQMEGKIDAFVCGVGSGGTLTGCGRYFRKVAPELEIVLADPKGSVLAPLVNEGKQVEAGSWIIEGIGEDFVPDICELDFVKRAYTVTDAESIAAAHDLLKKEGILCGSSSGTLLAAALRYCREQTVPKRVVTLVCDSGNKYLSKIYNDYWLDDQGFMLKPQSGDLRDLIARPNTAHTSVTVKPADTLQAAYRKMRMYDFSQLPVVDEGELVGLVSEVDILCGLDVTGGKFSGLVSEVMACELTTVSVRDSIKELLPIFQRGMVAIVMDGSEFLGLITPVDLLQYMRKKTGY